MYPKWITRAQGIGPVLVLNEAEETTLLEDWETEQLARAEAEAAKAKAEAQAQDGFAENNPAEAEADEPEAPAHTRRNRR